MGHDRGMNGTWQGHGCYMKVIWMVYDRGMDGT